MSFGTHIFAFLLSTYLGTKLLDQRIVIHLALVDSVKQVLNMVESNMNILNYFPVDLMPCLATAE